MVQTIYDKWKMSEPGFFGFWDLGIYFRDLLNSGNHANPKNPSSDNCRQ